MNALEILRTIRAAVAEEKRKGASAIAVVPLDNYLTGLEPQAAQPQAPPLSPDHALQAHIAVFQGGVQHNLEMFKSVIGAGQDARRASVTICGGAAVALLAFIGHMWPMTVGTRSLSLSSRFRSPPTWSGFCSRRWPAAPHMPRKRRGPQRSKHLRKSLLLFGVGSWFSYRIFHTYAPIVPAASSPTVTPP